MNENEAGYTFLVSDPAGRFVGFNTSSSAPLPLYPSMRNAHVLVKAAVAGATPGDALTLTAAEERCAREDHQSSGGSSGRSSGGSSEESGGSGGGSGGGRPSFIIFVVQVDDISNVSVSSVSNGLYFSNWFGIFNVKERMNFKVLTLMVSPLCLLFSITLSCRCHGY